MTYNLVWYFRLRNLFIRQTTTTGLADRLKVAGFDVRS